MASAIRSKLTVAVELAVLPLLQSAVVWAGRDDLVAQGRQSDVCEAWLGHLCADAVADDRRSQVGAEASERKGLPRSRAEWRLAYARTVRHGLLVANVGTYSDPRNVVRVAEAAEASGWEALFVWDHLAFVWGPPAADPWVTLGAVAASTSDLLLGTAVTPVARRRPHVLAHAVATLDVLCGGRVVFGAGLGGVASEFGAFGDEDDARVRAQKLDEGLDLLRRLWAGEHVEHRGRHYSIAGVALAPLPLQQPLPIWVGGNSPGALLRAARFDGWIANTADAERMTVSPDELADRIAATGRGDGFDVAVHGYSDIADPRAYAEAGATWWLEDVHDLRASLDDVLSRVAAGPPSLSGRPDEHAHGDG
jgi:probable F420-dependent oxidoreductase